MVDKENQLETVILHRSVRCATVYLFMHCLLNSSQNIFVFHVSFVVPSLIITPAKEVMFFGCLSVSVYVSPVQAPGL